MENFCRQLGETVCDANGINALYRYINSLIGLPESLDNRTVDPS